VALFVNRVEAVAWRDEYAPGWEIHPVRVERLVVEVEPIG
jgi:hypothetical protein